MFARRVFGGWLAVRAADRRREAYENDVARLRQKRIALVEQGLTAEQVARILWSERQELRDLHRRGLPRRVRLVLALRDYPRYGNPLGPPLAWLIERKSWNEIAESASRPGGGDLGLRSR